MTQLLSTLILSRSLIYEIQRTNETLLYKNISLILFLKGAHNLLLVWEIDGETYTQRGDFFLSNTFFRESGCANVCTPLQAEMPLIGCLFLARLSILCTLS